MIKEKYTQVRLYAKHEIKKIIWENLVILKNKKLENW